jgi:hypothetical protein
MTNKTNWPNTVNRYAEKLYKVFINKDTGPVDIVDFLIDFGQTFKANVSKASLMKLRI